MNNSRRNLISIAIAIFAFLSAAVFAQSKFTVIDKIGGDDHIPPNVNYLLLNAEGTVLTGQAGSICGGVVAWKCRLFLWRFGDSTAWLDIDKGVKSPIPIGINDDGSVIVGNFYRNGNKIAPFILKNGEVMAIKTVPGKESTNNDKLEMAAPGMVMGYSSERGIAIIASTDISGDDAAIIWRLSGNSALLPGKSGRGYLPVAISRDGNTIYGAAAERVNSGTRYSPVVWRSGGNPEEILSLKEFNNDGARIVVTSNDGKFFAGVTAGFSPEKGPWTKAYRWSIDGGHIFLGSVEDEKYGAGGVTIRAMSADGRVIVGNQNYQYIDSRIKPAKVYSLPIVWREGKGMTALEAILREQGSLEEGYHITNVQAISASGKVIAGLGLRMGESRETIWIAHLD